MSVNFAENFCTPPRKKRQIFWHSPNKQIPVRVDFKVERAAISKVSLHDIDSEEDRVLQLTVTLGLIQVLTMYSVLKTIPKNFPNRLNYFGKICKFIDGMDIVSDTVIRQAGIILDAITLPECNVEDVLWKASNELKMPFLVFLAPDLDMCIVEGCAGKLYGSEKEVTNITLFTMNGPVPGLKCVLSCKECGASIHCFKTCLSLSLALRGENPDGENEEEPNQEDEPAPVVVEEELPITAEQPIPVMQEEPDVMDEQPVPNVQEEPVVVDEQPVPNVQEEPVVVDEQPVPNVQEEPVVVDKQPVPNVQEEPVRLMEQGVSHGFKEPASAMVEVSSHDTVKEQVPGMVKESFQFITEEPEEPEPVSTLGKTILDDRPDLHYWTSLELRPSVVPSQLPISGHKKTIDKSASLFRVKQTNNRKKKDMEKRAVKKEVKRSVKTTRGQKLPKFLNKEIKQKFEVDGKIEEYKGWVEDLVSGQDGWKSAIYRIRYEDGETLQIQLYSDYLTGDVEIIEP